MMSDTMNSSSPARMYRPSAIRAPSMPGEPVGPCRLGPQETGREAQHAQQHHRDGEQVDPRLDPGERVDQAGKAGVQQAFLAAAQNRTGRPAPPQSASGTTAGSTASPWNTADTSARRMRAIMSASSG